MGTKYTTTSISGYNSSPPPDDGSATEANKVKWSTIKTKLPDPIKTAVESIDSKLTTWSDYGPTEVAVTTTLDADDNETVVVATSAVTIVLPDASTVGAGWRAYVKNSSASTIVIDRTTGSDTIDGSAADGSLAAGEGREIMANADADGFITLTSHGSSSGGAIPSGTRMLFQQTAAPSGWTKDTSTHNDKALRVVTGTVSSGGATAFTSVFGSGKTSGSTALTSANMPSTVPVSSITISGTQHTAGESQSQVLPYNDTGTWAGGSGTGHTHTLSLDLQYADVIIATKD